MSKLSILGAARKCEIKEYAALGFITVIHPDCQNVIRVDTTNGQVTYTTANETSDQYRLMVKAAQKYLNK